MKKKKYKCACCGCYTLDEYPFDVCPICMWEDTGLEDIDVYDGVNHNITLREARTNFIEFGACKREYLHYTRKPVLYETRECNDDYIVIDFQWPSIEEIRNMLKKTLSKKLSHMAVSLWAEDVLDNKFIEDKIYGYYPIGDFEKLILKQMMLLGDEEDESQECDEDVQKILDMIHFEK